MEKVEAKAIVSPYGTNSTWFGGNYNMNIYRGCCHGCIYCDSRSECYRIEDFDTVRAKDNAVGLIERDLRSKKRTGVVFAGAMSDPYNPFEKEEQLTRQSLELLDRYWFGAGINTKSALIKRDIDVLQRILSHSPVIINVTVTTGDDVLCGQIEREVCVSSERFRMIKELSDAGIDCGILLMPILPFINDTEENILSVVEQAAQAGAKWVYASLGVTLRQNQRVHYYQWLDKLYPGLKQEYIKLFKNEYSCSSPRSKELWNVFKNSCEKYGIMYKMKDIVAYTRRNHQYEQMSFF